MVDAVKNNMDNIIETCKIMGLQSLYLFGSGARNNEFNADSDLDFTFRFKTNKDGMPEKGYDYFDLMFALEKITSKKIDLVAEEKITNPIMQLEINKDKVKLYELKRCNNLANM